MPPCDINIEAQGILGLVALAQRKLAGLERV
jgi:hypothetical protein